MPDPQRPLRTASVNWFDGNIHIRVYSSDGFNVIERAINQPDTAWRTTDFSQPGAEVSATAWLAPDGAHIRVYCTLDDTTTEWCSDPGTPGWTKGGYTPT